ncbi:MULTISPECIES: geranylgeranyl reductase family protein [Spirulina sp. CCY15215]|uniref:NAD(P)/FAD-dependent oxidoreductase n=1 Tax=Spirulina sp. CCY15215 TaxID=2767591 RepID=UPI00194E2979|nr:geranylgeranyl reductase family protein [Spirulina major]
MLDCIIIGAGPGGASAAYHLAKRGRKVLVLEKAKLPRYKPCGGGVSPVVAQWFDFDFSPAIAAKVDGVEFTWQQGDRVAANLNTEPMWMVKRDVLDRLLLEQAQALGAEIRDETEVVSLNFNGTAWQVSTTGGNLEATYAIGADGATGICTQLFGFEEREIRPGGVLEINTPPDTPDAVHFDFGSLKKGFIWDFPQGSSHTASAVIMRGAGKNSEVKKQLLNYAKQLNLDASQFTYYDCPTVLWSEERVFHQQNSLLVGDAAGLADPLLAEGIRPALLSGLRAAEAIDNSLAGDNNALENYTQILQEEWGKDMGYAKTWGDFFYNKYNIPGMSSQIYKIGVKRPVAAKIMSQILCGEMRYSDVGEQVIKVFKKFFKLGK